MAQKNQDCFLPHFITALQVSFCLSVSVDTSRILCLILSYLDVFTLPWSVLRGDWWRFRVHAPLFKCLRCKDWIWNWLHMAVRKVMQEEGLPGRPPKAHNTGGWLTMLRGYSPTFSSLSCEKGTLQSFSSRWLKAKTFPEYNPAFNGPEGSIRWKRQGGDFWDLNTKLSWQALKEELKEPL